MAGRQKLSRPFDLPTGRALDLAYDLAPSAGVGDAGDEQLQRRGTTPTIHLGTWVVLGSGVAALGGAGLYELGRKAAEEDARQASTQQEANDSHSLAQERGTAAQVLALVGGVLTVTGGVLLALDLRAPQQDRATRVCDRHDPILERLSLGCRAEQCGVVLGGRF